MRSPNSTLPWGALAATGLAAVTLLAAGCTGSAGPGAGGDGAGSAVAVWAVQDPQNEPIIRAGIAQYQQRSATRLKLTTYVNDAYKQKLQVSMGSPNAPDIFFNWGGGNLVQYVNASRVVDLTGELSKNRAVADAFLPTVLNVGKINGKQYGLPCTGMQPALLFYNKEVFAKAGVQPPRTYDELLTLVDTFKARGVTPIALAGSQGWTELMYLMYGLDRVGGPQKFADIAAGKSGAWRDPAVTRALGMAQDLAKRGAFGSNFGSVNYDNTGAGKLFATGKAAMHLMGTWEYASQRSNNPDFAKTNLGWTVFPSVSGGVGDPKNVVGPPSNFYSIASSSKYKEAAARFLMSTLTSDSYVTGLVKAGAVPAVKGADTKMAGTESVEFTTFVFTVVAAAPSFTPAWDQALSPEAGTAVNTNLQKLFLSQITPKEFVDVVEHVN